MKATSRQSPPTATWPAKVHAMLKAAKIRQIPIVPDAGHSALIKLCENDPGMRVVRLTTEEEGVALLGGAWLGGEKGVLLMQSSGVGNCINMLSLPISCQFQNPPYRECPGTYNRTSDTTGRYTTAVVQDSYLLAVGNYEGRGGAESFTITIRYP